VYKRTDSNQSALSLQMRGICKHIRNATRLILAYDAQSNAFTDMVENTTDKTLKRVRAEVHLSKGEFCPNVQFS
jgi:hypothetical protein